MTKLGWTILTVILVAVSLFLSVLSFSSAPEGGFRDRVRQALPSFGRASPGVLVMPVAGVARDAVTDSWGDARGGGTRGHRGTDIMAPRGTPVVAAADGRVEKLFQSDLGGTTIYIRSADGHWIHYYAHLAGYAPGLHEGQVVKAGEQIAYVGDTGDAGPGNYHLHFGVQRMHGGEGWWQGEDVNPYPLLAGTAARR
ncbi:M23 family metallopeptidase [Sphingomonas mollis]|uniref:M23 family metallopeptidase n=1 Tax=Sphingomonas mollis TaxID=2795726 RepID=A0ABS0XNH8_9SPHN|nr:M23 family metallopeptidase [Sphingomonas sp. BT553]MBJ6121293.1 M23 family metallopeptidase [Sphingomonas sp. BT553]